MRRFRRGIRGNRWCSIWNCRPPWNQSFRSQQTRSSVPSSWSSNHDLPRPGGPLNVSREKWELQIWTWSRPTVAKASSTNGRRSSPGRRARRAAIHAANAASPAHSAAWVWSGSRFRSFTSRISPWRYRFTRATAMMGKKV